MFLLPLLAIVLGAGWLTYYSFARWLSLQGMGKLVLALILLGIIFGFFAVSALSRLGGGIVIRYLYIIFAVLVGFYAFLFFAVVLGWAIIGVAKLVGVALAPKLIAWAMITLAVLYSGYNVWNAFDIRIKNIDVQIKNLPQQWKGKTIVQLSDVHLGNIHSADFMEKVVRMANAQKPDIIAITGDLFDGMDGDLTPLIKPINSLEAKNGIYFITGNHENYLGLDKALEIIGKTKIQYIDDKIIHDNGLQIIGLAYGQDFSTRDIKKIITFNPDYDPKIPSVLLYHVPLPSAVQMARELGIGLMLSGHTHVGQLLPFKPITDIVYKGYDYGLHQESDFTEYTSSGIGTWGPPMRSGNHPEIVVIHLK